LLRPEIASPYSLSALAVLSDLFMVN
jgi:hypothetical protein